MIRRPRRFAKTPAKFSRLRALRASKYLSAAVLRVPARRRGLESAGRRRPRATRVRDAEASALRSRVAAKGRSAGADAAAEAIIERYAAGGPGFAVDAARLREGLATFAERVGATDDAPLP